MNLVLLTHPDFLGSQSQPRFAQMLARGFSARGHRVEVRQPVARVRQLASGRLAKWAGYADQYLLFPLELARAARRDPPDTLYVFCDQALGPWVPRLAHRPHVVHCHDLLALRSALGLVPENPTGASGRLYQRMIRSGFRQARHFVSISQKTRADLHAHGGVQALTSEVVYNGLNHPFRRRPRDEALSVLRLAGLPEPSPQGFLLHVGGGQWYKNTAGVAALYAAHAARHGDAAMPPPALWLVSPPPSAAVSDALAAVPSSGTVRFFQGVPTAALEALYSLAEALLFPSLAEGFGWPIAEAMACGCPVVTTGEPPMDEVGGPHAFYLPRPAAPQDLADWAGEGAALLARIAARSPQERDAAAHSAMTWTARFDADRAIERYLEIYASVLARETGAVTAAAAVS